MKKEIRSIRSELMRSERNGERRVRGYAALFNVRSKDLGGFVEIIERGAFDDVINKSDVLCVLNHNPERGLLARSTNGSGSLTLGIDSRGLFYEFDAPKTALGDELLEGLERGDIKESSFSFTVEGEDWTFREGEPAIRTITKVRKLYDVSPVFFPAYEGTEVGKRYEEEHRKWEEREEQKYKDFKDLKEIDEQDEERKLKKYFSQFKI